MKKTKQVILLLFIIFILWSIYNYDNKGLIYSLLTNDQATIKSTVTEAGIFAPIIFTIIVILEVVIAPIPGSPIYFISGIIFPPLIGALLAIIGNIIGAYLAFLLARSYGRKIVEKFITKKDLKILDKFSREKGAITIFLLRVNPLTSTDLFSYLAGISKLNIKKFLIATTLGLIPPIVTQAYLGNILSSSTALYNIFLLSSLIYVILAIIIIVKIRK